MIGWSQSIGRFTSSRDNATAHLATIRTEALRMEEHATHLNAGIYNRFWEQYLPLKFVPTTMERRCAGVLNNRQRRIPGVIVEHAAHLRSGHGP